MFDDREPVSGGAACCRRANKVTPAMAKAGEQALDRALEWRVEGSRIFIDEDDATVVYNAMERARLATTHLSGLDR